MAEDETRSDVLEAEDEAAAAARSRGAPDEITEEALAARREALAQIVKYGDPVLRSQASPVTEFDQDLVDELARMVRIMRDAMGVGLAATQLGILRQALVFQAGPDAPATALVNPSVEWTSDDAVTAEEGCLSIPGVVVDVERPLHARVVGQGADGSQIEIEASGLEARVLQHEIDHLNGVLMLEHAPREQRKAALRALREGESYAPPRPEGEDDEPVTEA
jgi:peptide deformylase